MTLSFFPLTEGVKGGFFTRQGGVSQGVYASLNGGIGSHDEAACVQENRRRIQTHLQVDSLVSCAQVHGAEVVEVTAPWEEAQRPCADAMVTATAGIGLGILTADCAPVLFFDSQANVVGAAHAGWKGAVRGVLESTLDAMEKLGSRREHIHAWVGPCISRKNYEVGADFEEALCSQDANGQFFLSWWREQRFFDVSGYVQFRLLKAGVSQPHVFQGCTYGDEERFFSFRRTTHRHEKDYGRQLSVIAL